jgi:phenylalanyl-tRNA synthetase beta chain
MRVSWKWLNELVDLSSLGTGVTGAKALGELLTRRGLEVEDLQAQAAGWEQVVSVKILERNRHPEADRLSVCRVSLGSSDPLEIVCGAQNMKAGDIVALAQIGAKLPNGLKIEKSKIRGVISNGMLCSEEELGLADKSEGILILSESTPLGRPLAEVLGRDDIILTLKLTANRSDCLSHVGLAREVASALGKKVCFPKGYSREQLTALVQSKGPAVSLKLEAGQDAPQFWAVSLKNVKVGPSPSWLVQRLEALGSRSINSVVDATNLVMLELGQPTHAYDASKIQGGVLGVRSAKVGEELPLLDGTQVKLQGEELVIFDGAHAVGLAGVMGGGNSEVESGTTEVLLEAAEFAPRLIRRASARHAKKTEAAHRFERGVDPTGVAMAMGRLVQLIQDLAGGEVVGASSALDPSRSEEGLRSARAVISVDPSFFESFLGMKLNESEIEKEILAQGCVIQKVSTTEWKVTPPPHRLDLVIREDLAEEIARSVGYDRIPSTIPMLTTAPISKVSDASMGALTVLNRAKDSLVRSGLLESVNLAFTHENWLKELGFTNPIRVLNPLSEDFAALQPALLPGLIRNTLDNWRHHFGSEVPSVRLFELRPTFHLPEGASRAIEAKGETETGVVEKWKLACVISGGRIEATMKVDAADADFFDLKAVVERLFQDLGTKGIRLSPLSATRTPESPFVKLLHPGQSVEILAGNAVAGVMGLVHPAFARAWKARSALWVAELDWDLISKLSRGPGEERAYKAWSPFPPMERDFALLVKSDVSADKLVQSALKAGKPFAKSAKIFDIYRGSQVPEGMTSLALKVIFSEDTRVLQESETEGASAKIIEAWKKEFGAELR